MNDIVIPRMAEMRHWPVWRINARMRRWPLWMRVAEMRTWYHGEIVPVTSQIPGSRDVHLLGIHSLDYADSYMVGRLPPHFPVPVSTGAA